VPASARANAPISIIAVLGDGPITGKTYRLVAYESAHIDGVASEKVRSGHSTQGHPDTVEEVRSAETTPGAVLTQIARLDSVASATRRPA
jgi:hypothetical protein